MRNIGFILIIWFLLTGRAHSYVLVEDIPNLANNLVSEVKNYAQYIEQTYNQISMLGNQVTQITNQIVQLERMGDPRTYVNMLGLDQFFSAIEQVKDGAGTTISAYRNVANGAMALGYTANGLYSDLRGRVDRYGNAVQWNTNAFRKYQSFNDMSEAYNTSERTYNTQMGTLQAELKLAITNLNRERTQIGKEAYSAQINAIAAEMNAAAHNANLSGQRATIMQAANLNDVGRMQEADRQTRAQENMESAQNLTRTLSSWISGQ